MSSDWIIIPDFNVPEHVEKDTGLLDNEGRNIIKLPDPVGFHKFDYNKYGVKNG